MAQIAPPVPLTTQPRRLATNRDRSRQSTQTTAEAGPQAILSRGAVASRPRAVAPGAPARGLPFWRWCSLRSETAWFRAHGRLWRLVVRARPLARIAPSQARDATPAALPRFHRRRLLPSLPPAPPLRPRPPRRTQPLDPRGRAPPVFMKTTDQPNGPTPGGRRPECPVTYSALRRKIGGVIRCVAHRGVAGTAAAGFGRRARRPVGVDCGGAARAG